MKQTGILFALALFIAALNGNAQVIEQDSLALVDFYNATNGQNWTDNTNWVSNNPVDKWYGIEVSNRRVVGIDLPNNNIQGTIPETFGDLNGLWLIKLQNNQINGTIPESFSNLTGLSNLYLNNNHLVGPIPSGMANIKYSEVSVQENHFMPKDILALKQWQVKFTFNYFGQIILCSRNARLNVCANSNLILDIRELFSNLTLNTQSYGLENPVSYVASESFIYNFPKVGNEHKGEYYFNWFDDTCETHFKTEPLVVEVSDFNVADWIGQVEEYAPSGTLIGQLQAPANFGHQVTYALLEGNDRGAFHLSMDGEITVKNSDALDFETQRIYYLDVEASDGTNKEIVTIIVPVESINEFPPVINDQHFEIHEGLQKNLSFAELVASDPDLDPLTYEILGGNDEEIFRMYANHLSLAKEVEMFDNRDFVLEIQVSDGKHTDKGSITIHVNEFSETASLPGGGQKGGLCFVLRDNLYIGLGENKNSFLSNLFRFDAIRNEWEPIGFFGKARSNAVSFVIDNIAYFGTGESDTGYLNDFWKFDSNKNEFERIANFPGTPRTGAVAFTIGQYAYVGTGVDTSATEQNDFYRYDPKNNSWTQIASPNCDPRTSGVGFAIESKGYISGGYYIKHYDEYISSTFQLSDVQEYDPATDTWKEKIFADGLNLSSNYASALTAGGAAYICYGTKDCVVKYTPATNEVENLGDLCNIGDSRLGGIAFVLNKKAYFGYGQGSVFIDNSFFNDIHDLGLLFNQPPVVAENIVIEANENSSMQELIEANDPDGDKLYYRIVGENPADLFRIDDMGSLMLNNRTYFDTTETISQYKIKVEITDRQDTVTTDITINRIPYNDNTPVLESAEFTLPENSPEGTIIGQLYFHDKDGDELTLTMGGNNSQYEDAFFILQDGTLIVAEPKALNYELLHKIDITIFVSDGTNKSFGNVMLHLTDIEETGIDLYKYGSLKIYPNPAQEYIYLDAPNLTSNFTVQLYSIQGSLLSQHHINGKRGKIQLPKNSGTYLLKIMDNENGAFYKRIIRD